LLRQVNVLAIAELTLVLRKDSLFATYVCNTFKPENLIKEFNIYSPKPFRIPLPPAPVTRDEQKMEKCATALQTTHSPSALESASPLQAPSLT
jgi:hypothetical protein